MTARHPAPTDRFDRRLLAPMMLGSILNPVNSSIIAVALVPIGVGLGAPAAETAWLISALYLATAIGQPLVGRLVDLYGARRLFLAGAVLTIVAGVVGTLAPSIWVLVAARVVLGLGTCAGYPAAMALIRGEADRTGMASPSGVLAALSVATQTIAVVGPSLGGLLIGIGGWRSTLVVNVVLGLASLVLGWLFVPATPPGRQAAGQMRDGTARLDTVGVGLFAALLLGMLVFLMDPTPARLWLPALAVVAGVAFTRWELRRPEPFIDVRVFAGNVPLLLTYARSLVASTVSYCFLYGFTQWLEQGRGFSPSGTGLLLLPTFAVGIVATVVAGRRGTVRVKLVVGAVAQLLAAGMILLLGDGAPVWLLLGVVVMLGLPQGLVNLSNQTALYHQARRDKVGVSAGLLRTFMYLGAMVASSTAGLVFGRQATTTGLHGLGLVMLVAAAVFLVLAVADRGLAAIDAGEREAARR
ncbi:MFS transporter [Tersicoccus sp. MR15.9]|uniref:MFS transporter n=1 Tax=Tersicoccus mangrovi TaxID=3121635 RepID=UPI002FE546DB